MIDLDDALRSEGAQWRSRLDAPPDLADAAARVVPQLRSQRRIGLGLAASVAVIAAIAVVALVVVLRGSGRPVAVPAAVRFHAHSIPYAGLLSFRNVVADATDPRVLRVFIKKDDLNADVCYSVHEVGVVADQTAREVRVLVAGYAPPAGAECPGMAWGWTPVTIRLAQPLGGRTLIDATDGKSHPVLDPATVPQLHRFPTGCPLQGGLTWNERTGLADRYYENRACIIDLQIGTPALIARLEPPGGSQQSSVPISGHPATIWYEDMPPINHRFVLQWRAGPDQVIRLDINFEHRADASRRAVIAAAESIR